MEIVILGAGQVGSKVAERLVDNYSITVVDKDGQKLKTLQDQHDLRTVHGDVLNPYVLEQAGCENAEMVVAVTNEDASNIVACKLCSVLYNVHMKVARIRSSELTQHKEMFSKENFNIDIVFCPEQIVTDAITSALRHPGCIQVHKLGGGKAVLCVVKVDDSRFDSEVTVENLTDTLTQKLDFRLVALYRDNFSIFPGNDTIVENGDEAFFITDTNHLDTVVSTLRGDQTHPKRITIAGGGNVGLRLAMHLEQDYKIKIIERNKNKCGQLARRLNRALVLNGDVTDEELLRDEDIRSSDVFCSVTQEDEVNIMSALLAKHLGVPKLITIINQPTYADVLQKNQIDIAISPLDFTIGALLARLRKGDIAAVHSLRRGSAEAIEAIVHGDSSSSQIINRKVSSINWPKGSTLCAIVREKDVLINIENEVIQEGDHLIIFVNDKKIIPTIEQLLQVTLRFF